MGKTQGYLAIDQLLRAQMVVTTFSGPSTNHSAHFDNFIQWFHFIPWNSQNSTAFLSLEEHKICLPQAFLLLPLSSKLKSLDEGLIYFNLTKMNWGPTTSQVLGYGGSLSERFIVQWGGPLCCISLFLPTTLTKGQVCWTRDISR